jgi:hypothetical protein
MNTTEKLRPNDKPPAAMQVSYKPDSKKVADALPWLFGSSPARFRISQNKVLRKKGEKE